MTNSADRFFVNIGWLIKLRWFAVFGQLATISVVLFLLRIELPMPVALLAVVSLTVVSNVMLTLWVRSQTSDQLQSPESHDMVPGILMVMDMLSLAALLFASGGPNNPFAVFFLVNVSLSAIVLKRHWAWGMAGLAVVCFLLVVFNHVSIPELLISSEMLPVMETRRVSLLQSGLIISFALSSGVITYFVTRITDELRQQEADLRHAQEQQARSEKLEALGTLAAGTAHELATPLSTIAVVARDVERFFEDNPPQHPDGVEVVQDIHLIRSQLDRCRSILNRMAGQAGQAVGESIFELSVADLWDLVLEDLSPEVEENDLIQIDMPADLADELMLVPSVVLSQALRGLVQNALDASGPENTVDITIRGYASHWHWGISDHGTGISADVLKRISEPFFSTKPVGKGMGLGVFLARNVVERLGGSLDITSEPGIGTQVVVRFPRNAKSGSGT